MTNNKLQNEYPIKIKYQLFFVISIGCFRAFDIAITCNVICIFGMRPGDSNPNPDRLNLFMALRDLINYLILLVLVSFFGYDKK